jgi:hypothetical protein
MDASRPMDTAGPEPVDVTHHLRSGAREDVGGNREKRGEREAARDPDVTRRFDAVSGE